MADRADYEQERHECRAELARRMGWAKVPHDIWGYLDDGGLVYDAIVHDDEESWGALVDGARACRIGGARSEVLTAEHGSTGRKQRPDTDEIEVELDGYTRLRGQVVAEMAAERPDVRSFRHVYLAGRLLSDEEADEFLRSDGIGQPRLERLVSKLVRSYRWPKRQARRFVLTGHPPAPVYLSVAVGGGDPPLVPDKARIWIDVDAWVDAEEVAGTYRAAQRQLLGGDNRKIPEKSLEVLRFVHRQTREHGIFPPWPELQRRWNREYPQWHYGDRNGLWRAYRRARERLLYPGFNRPKWKRHGTS